MNKAASGTIKFGPLQCLYWDVALQKAFYWRGTKEAGSSLQNASYNGWNCRRFLLLPASPMYSLEGVEGLATLTVETWTSLRPEQPNLKSLIGFWQLATVLIMLINVRHHPPPQQLYHFDKTELHQCYIQSLHVVVVRMQNWIQFEQIQFDHHLLISVHAEVS